MAALPDDWTDPDSTAGTLVDLGWFALCILVFGALALVEPLFFEVPVTTTRIAVSVLVGLVLAAVVVGFSVGSERAREFWTGDSTRRFAALFAFIVAMQLVLRTAPGWTVLVTLATALAALALRLAAYRRHRSR
jgi:hypothetical protein